MGNDYIYIRCKFCREHLRIAGYMPSCDLQLYDSASTELVSWVNKHLLHNQSSLDYKHTLDGAGIEFVTEAELAEQKPCVTS